MMTVTRVVDNSIGESMKTMAMNDQVTSATQVEDNLKAEGEVAPQRDWSENEEKKVKLKLDCVLMSLLVLGLFALQMDKGNLSNILTTSFIHDINIPQNNVNSGNQLQLAAIVIFEIPFNMIQARIGAPIWITFEAFAWGTVCLCQAFISNMSSFYATRFLLGTFEAGYLPGSMLLLSCFYTRGELAMRTTILYIGNYLAQGTSSLVAAGVFQMDGMRGLHDWQWLFLIDGGFTIVVAIAFLLFLPGSTTNTTPVCRIKSFDFFSERERHILTQRIACDDTNRKVPLSGISIKEAVVILSNWRLWGHCFINIITLTPKGGLQLYTPTIIKALGFANLQANALTSVGYYGLILLSLAAAYVSDRTRLRGPMCLICGAYSLLFAGVQYGLTSGGHGKWLRYAIFMLLNSGNSIGQGVNDAWLASNSPDPKERTIGLALCVIGSNLGGLAGQQLFRSEDAPRYTRGFLAVMCMYVGSLILTSLQMGYYMFSNRRLKKTETNEEPAVHSDGRPRIEYDI